MKNSQVVVFRLSLDEKVTLSRLARASKCTEAAVLRGLIVEKGIAEGIGPQMIKPLQHEAALPIAMPRSRKMPKRDREI